MTTTTQPRWTKADAAALHDAQLRDLAQRYAAEALANTPCPAWCVTDHANDKDILVPDPEPDGDLYSHDSAELSGLEVDEYGERVMVLAELNYTRAGVYNRKVNVYAERTLSPDEARKVAGAMLKAAELLEAQQ